MNYIYTSEFPDAGSGNKLFVFSFGSILSHIYKIPYFHPGIPEMKINPNFINIDNKFKNIQIVNFLDFLNAKKTNYNCKKNYNVIYSFTPTIEDYRLFKSYIPFCKTIYPFKRKKYNNKDLVYHFRAGDYLVCNNHYLLNGDKLESLLQQIDFDNLYIVTNLTKKTEWNMVDYISYRNNYLVHGEHATPFQENQCVQPDKFQEVLDHVNSVINVCNKYKCNWISESVYEDFNTIRSFKKIIINVSTLSWWAAVLSDADEVYVPEKWKYKKIKNKNLPNIDLPGWKRVDL